MKLYRFRSLVENDDLIRAKYILETGFFWCSGFSELNDPVEGAFTIMPNNAGLDSKIINAIYNKKRGYKICSFSTRDAFKNPIMWGYYTSGFKGMTIEVKVNEGEVNKIKYVDNITHLNDGQNIDEKTENILTTKLTPWKHEKEYRFLKKSANNYHKIGIITAVYFGNPYGRAVNQDSIYKDNSVLSGFNNLKENLINVANSVKCYSIKIIGEKVMKDKLLN